MYIQGYVCKFSGLQLLYIFFYKPRFNQLRLNFKVISYLIQHILLLIYFDHSCHLSYTKAPFYKTNTHFLC